MRNNLRFKHAIINSLPQTFQDSTSLDKNDKEITMNCKKALTIIFTCIIFLNANSAIAEGQADRENYKVFAPISVEFLIQHINNTFGTTAAGNGIAGMNTESELNRLIFSYSRRKQHPQI
jgi:hypothetical protein